MIAGFVILLVVNLAAFLYTLNLYVHESRRTAVLDTQLAEEKARVVALETETKRLQMSAVIPHAEVEADKILEAAQTRADEITAELDNYMAEVSQWVDSAYEVAEAEAAQITADARQGLPPVTETEAAREKKEPGKGDAQTTFSFGGSLLDGLARQHGDEEAGAELKKTRETSREMVKNRKAATCEYVDAARRDGAENLVIDAFDGRVESLLAGTRADNADALEKEIREAFAMVNSHGKIFRTRITDEYLVARLAELKSGAKVQQLHS